MSTLFIMLIMLGGVLGVVGMNADNSSADNRGAAFKVCMTGWSLFILGWAGVVAVLLSRHP